MRQVKTEGGFTTVELAMAMTVTALVATVMLSWVFSVAAADDRHLSNDRAFEDLRTVSDQLTREVRSAEYVTVAAAKSLTFWLDHDRDDVLDAGELVTWTINPDDSVVRSTDLVPGGSLAHQISFSASGFTFDSDTPGDVTRVTLTLVATAGTGAQQGETHFKTDVYLRNA